MFVDTSRMACSAPKFPCSGRSRTVAILSGNSTPGCWGPMITPPIRGGHELCQPVAVPDPDLHDEHSGVGRPARFRSYFRTPPLVKPSDESGIPSSPAAY